MSTEVDTNAPNYLEKTGETLIKELRLIGERNPEGLLDAVVAAADKSEPREFMRIEMARLTDTIKFIRTKFEDVKGTLHIFDQTDFRRRKKDGSAGGKPIGDLERKWDEFRETFDKLVKDSQEGARRGALLAKEFRTKIFDMALSEKDPATAEDVVSELESYIESVEKAEQNSSTYEEGFDALRVDIKTFKTDMQEAIKAAEDNLAKQLSDVKEKIEEIETEIEKWTDISKKAKDAFLAIVGVGLAGAQSGIGALIALSPWAWGALIFIAVAAISAGATWGAAELKLKRLNKDLTDAKAEQTGLNGKIETLESLKTLFETSEKDITAMEGKLATLSRIWRIIGSDAKNLKDQMGKLRTSPRSAPGMRREIKALDATYLMLHNYLSTYATQVGGLEDSKPSS